jgi:O-antigen/teichoic acid export membrane protein
VSSLLARSLVLSFSRFSNQAIVLLSPVFLVRLLPVSEYGSYREFMLYAGLIAPLVTFGVTRSLPYLIPKYPKQERQWVTQTALLILASSTVAVAGIYFAADVIRANTSFDFVVALQLYILFFINLDFLEAYWLGKKRSDLVLYYSSGRLVARVGVAIVLAYAVGKAHAVVSGLVALELVRCLLVLWYTISRKWFSLAITRAGLVLQFSYFLPLGAGAIVEVLNRRVGMLFISTNVGAEALAYFAIGALATQIINVLRGSVSDVIFPEIVEIRAASLKDALPLWQRATVLFCVLLFPMAMLFSIYADVVVTVLFTHEYSAAIPVFSVFAVMLYLDCFDFHLPLRVQNANKFFVVGSIIALCTNIAFLYPSFAIFGLIGPAIALLLSRLAFTFYLAVNASRLYKMRLQEMVRWPEVGKVLGASLVCAPILYVGQFTIGNFLLRGIIFGGLYLVGYLWVVRFMRVWDVLELVRRLSRSMGLKRGEVRKPL